MKYRPNPDARSCVNPRRENCLAGFFFPRMSLAAGWPEYWWICMCEHVSCRLSRHLPSLSNTVVSQSFVRHFHKPVDGVIFSPLSHTVCSHQSTRPVVTPRSRPPRSHSNRLCHGTDRHLHHAHTERQQLDEVWAGRPGNLRLGDGGSVAPISGEATPGEWSTVLTSNSFRKRL